MAYRARFIPRHPEKYAGDVTKIFARSSWEMSVMKFLDSSTAVIKWGSEEIKIPYIKPTDNRVHHYYPDFIVVYRSKSGAIEKEILEVKPLKESLLVNAKNDHDKIAFAINLAKWNAAEEFAKRHGMKFRVVTEKTMFAQKKPRSVSNKAAKAPRAPKAARKAGK